MLTPELASHLQMILDQIRSQSEIASGVLDLDLYRVQVALFWIQIAATPEEIGATESDLEAIYAHLNEAVQPVLGQGQTLREVFAYLLGGDGEAGMKRLKLKTYQQDLIEYFGTLITDPDEHRRRMQAARTAQQDDSD